jgi:hypothetical protein
MVLAVSGMGIGIGIGAAYSYWKRPKSLVERVALAVLVDAVCHTVKPIINNMTNQTLRNGVIFSVQTVWKGLKRATPFFIEHGPFLESSIAMYCFLGHPWLYEWIFNLGVLSVLEMYWRRWRQSREPE